MSEEREDLVSAEDVIEDQKEELVVEDQEEELSVDNDEEVEQEDDSDPEVVERAKKYGHLSKEEWIAQGRNPEDWKSPEEFDKTGKILEQIYALRKKVDQRDREIHALVEYQQRTSQREYEKAKQELENRLAASKDDMDVEGVAHYTKELVKLQDMEQNTQVQQQQRLQYQAQQQFIERNQHWFNDRNPDLKQRAIEIDNEIKEKLPTATYDQIAQMIETQIKYEYPERVLGQTKSRPTVSPSQSSVNKTAVNKTSVSRVFRELPQELKDAYSAHKRIRESMGEELTELEFIERLKKDGEL